MSNSLPRGVRNRNPGNIDFNPANHWVGQIGKEPGSRFCLFDTPENGIRALRKLLHTYYNKHGLHTVASIIKRWAPEVENDAGLTFVPWPNAAALALAIRSRTSRIRRS